MPRKRRKWLIIVVSISIAVATVFGWRSHLAAQKRLSFAESQQAARRLGALLSVDLVDGYFIVQFPLAETDDHRLAQIIPHLRALSNPSLSLDYQKAFGIDLSGTKVSDQGLKAISELPLVWVQLNKTSVTDRGLECLRSQRALRLVTVQDTACTTAGMRSLERSLPSCWITTF